MINIEGDIVSGKSRKLPLFGRRIAGDQTVVAALEWARWCRNRRYILGDSTLPLDRYQSFTAPVLAYSFGDDKWGTARSVDRMMRAYPNLERRHVEPYDAGLARIGHVGYFKPVSAALWQDTIDWLDTR